MVVAFAGEKDASKEVYPDLIAVLLHLIKYENATLFFVDGMGAFCEMAQYALEEMCVRYAHIRYRVAKPPYCVGEKELCHHAQKVILSSDTVITYVKDPDSEAANLKRMALAYGKNVIELTK